MFRQLLFTIIATTVAFGAQAQSGITSAALKSVATTALEQATTNTSDITGKWTYSTPGIKMATSSTSSSSSLGSMLKNAGGSAASSVVESKLAEYLEKIGIKEGLITIEFNSDGTFTMPVKGKNASGKYTYDSSSKTVKLTIVGINVSGQAEVSGSTLRILFSAEKFTQFVGTIASSASSSSLSNIASFLSQYDDIQAGLAFKKAE